VIVPKVGMSFVSETDAYEMYNSYAGTVGFSIRKSDLKRRADKTIYSRVIVRSSQEYAEAGSSNATMRTGCKALIKFEVSREEIYIVQKVELDHNHVLATLKKKHMLRSQRHVIDVDKQLIAQIWEAGMRPTQVYEFMKQYYGGADKVPFLRMDCNNKIGREQNKYLESNDAQILLEYLKNKQIEDAAFFLCYEN
jgi:zinc finger SWIM domain-containing protein 3